VAKGLRDRHGVRILLLGDEREAPIIREMAEKIGDGAWDLSGRTDLEKLAALLAICHIVISNDSGPMHLASALGTPVVALFGSTNPDATAPIGPHRIVQAQVDCAPCLRRECPEDTYRCLREITPDAVLLAAEDLLLEAAAARGPVS
jgi:heptosyltransferase-2